MRRASKQIEQLWRQRIEGARSFPGSIADYCKREGIESSSFYSWRRRFRAEAKPLALQPFVSAVVQAHPIQACPDARPPLPDPKWVGEVLSALLRGLV